MHSLSTALLLVALWGSYVPTPIALSTSFTPSKMSLSRESQTKPLAQETEITKTAWRYHPKIKAVDRVVSSVNAGLKKGSFITSERRFESCGDRYFTLRRIARDSKGVVRWYEDYSEGEDASFDFRHYYDRAGRLRFVLAVARAANGTREQHRIYFDETGRRIWEANKRLKGLGCPGCFPDPYPEEGLAFDPSKSFVKDDGCKEIKPRTRR